MLLNGLKWIGPNLYLVTVLSIFIQGNFSYIHIFTELTYTFLQRGMSKTAVAGGQDNISLVKPCNIISSTWLATTTCVITVINLIAFPSSPLARNGPSRKSKLISKLKITAIQSFTYIYNERLVRHT